MPDKIRGERSGESSYQAPQQPDRLNCTRIRRTKIQQAERNMISPGDLVVFVFAVSVVLTYVSLVRKFIKAAESENAPQHA
jgi:hypothetical protein